MGIKRIVDTDFWTDGKVEDFSPEDKYFMLYLMTNPKTTQLGIYEMSIKQAAFWMGYSIESVSVLLERFEKKYGMIAYSKDTREVAIKNYLRHSIIKGGAPVRDCLVKEMRAVKNKDLISYAFASIKEYEDLNETVKNIITEYEEKNGALYYHNEIHNENDNDNDNDNEVSYPVSHNDTSTIRQTEKPAKPVKHKYGEYKNVLLTDDELNKLKTEYSDWQDRIERLSSYVASTGKKYKSHYATIRNWAKKDKEQPQRRKEIVPEWMNKNRFNNFEQRSYDFEDLEKKLLVATTGTDAELKARADALRERLGGT